MPELLLKLQVIGGIIYRTH